MGPTGPQGIPGPTGPAGGGGGGGNTVRVTTSWQKVYSANASMWFEQSCPAGYRVVSGGVEASAIVAIVSSYPVSDVRWKLGIESMRGGSTDARMHIVCIGE